MSIKIKNINHATSAEIKFLSGFFYLKINGIFSTLFANYSGSFELRNISSGFNMRKGNKTFMINTNCFREFKGDQLFSYYGTLNLSKIRIYNFNGQIVKPTIIRATNAINKEKQLVENMDVNIENLGVDKNTELVDRNFIKLNMKKNKKNTILKKIKQTSTGATKSGKGGVSGEVETGGGGGGY